MSYGITIAPPLLRWPVHEPAEIADYTLDASAELGTDTLSGVTATVAPSGAGELTPSALSVTGSSITLWLSGGVAGRQHVVSITGSTLSGRTFQWPVRIAVDTSLAVFPLAAPPSIGYGTPIVWGGNAPPAPLSAAVATVSAAGTNQATAAAVTALAAIVTGGVTGGGLILPAIGAGTIRVLNAWSQDVLVYPIGTGQIGAGAAGVAVIVSPGVGVDFSTAASATQWYAS